MSTHQSWDFDDLDGYVRQGEPEQAERADNWQVAIGLQAVDGLKTSSYLLETAKDHIEGRIDIAQAQQRIRGYYQERDGREQAEGTEEADIVSSRIAEMLGERSFTFSPVELQTIHRRLFDQILPRAGKYRTYDITKAEWVLNGETVYYATADSIEDTLRYDFAQEREFDYRNVSDLDAAHHVARFISDIWQIHPFSEGNTRTVAIFAIKYLRSLGFGKVDNESFKAHSWYFRNALVRANYNNRERGIRETSSFLDCFFENLVCDAHHELKNRTMHVNWSAEDVTQETTQEIGETTQEMGIIPKKES